MVRLRVMNPVSSTVQQAESLISNLDSKLDGNGQTATQYSPGSAKSEDSGVDDATRKSSNPAKLSRHSSRLSGTSSVLEQLEMMIVSDEWVGREDSGPGAHPPLSKHSSREHQKLSELGRTLVTSSSLKSYIDLLSSHHRQSIASWLYGNTNQALSQQFRFPEGQIYCSDTEASLALSVKNGIGHAVKLALRHAYGNEYLTKGWRSFVEKGAPVVYVSPALHMDMTTYLASEYGISDVIQLPKLEGDLSEIEGRIDHVAFEKILDDDIAAGKLPLMVIGVVGSTILGQNDMISKILELRKTKIRFWLHIVGQAIAALTLKEPTELLVHVLSQVDSVTLPLALWLGIPAAPVVTLHRSVEGYKASYKEKLDTLPWWVATQYLTNKRISDTIEQAYLQSKLMLKGLSSVENIEIVGIENPIDFANRVYKNQYTAPTVLIFKYKYKAIKEAVKIHKELSQKEENEANHDELVKAERNLKNELEYGDSLNSWMGQGLLAECRSLGIHMIELGGNHGTAFRFCPLEHAASLSSRIEHVQQFIKQLTDVIRIVDSTVAARNHFPEMKEQYASLTILPIQKWAGVGAVCYVPSIVKEVDCNDWNDNQKQQISHLNMELVRQLRSVDSAFSSGESAAYGISCIKFGMLSDSRDLLDLLKMVAEKGFEIEHSQEYLDTLADQIRQGIETANKDLQKESDLRLQQEGVIRQLPIMGSLVNWWSPMDKESQNIRGRSFNLKTGEIQPTDVLYKIKNGDQKSPMIPIDTPQTPHEINKTEEKNENTEIEGQLATTTETAKTEA